MIVFLIAKLVLTPKLVYSSQCHVYSIVLTTTTVVVYHTRLYKKIAKNEKSGWLL